MSDPTTDTPIGVRWTIGDVSDEGFEALRLSTRHHFLASTPSPFNSATNPARRSRVATS